VALIKARPNQEDLQKARDFAQNVKKGSNNIYGTYLAFSVYIKKRTVEPI